MGAPTMNIHKTHSTGRSASQGISLIIVLIMLVIIGITSATAMRSATSEQRATNNLRAEATAQQYAEAALRYCEDQIRNVPDAGRNAKLKLAVIPTTAFGTAPLWDSAASWATGAGAASRVILTAAQIGDANTTAPTFPPECMVEMQGLSAVDATRTVAVVTARGFSTDYARDDANGGVTTKGAVVWLQSIVNAN